MLLRYSHSNRYGQQGFTYIEMMLSVTIMGVVMLALMGVMNSAAETGGNVRGSNDLTRQARFALNRMVDMTSRSHRLLLPLNDNPNTNWPEHIREQTIPASAPIGDSTFASAVLAVTLPRDIDLDQDGVSDADDDGDGQFNEDLPNDNQHDNAPGIAGIDDDGDGAFDESAAIFDDDEDGVSNEDPLDGIDNDGDGSVDEDAPSDMNADGCPGICGVDEDSDGSIDEGGDTGDDDELGGSYEDSYDPVVFYLDNGSLKERMPVPWDANASGSVTGEDFIVSDIAANVTRFRVERVDTGGGLLVDLTLELTDPISGETVSLQTRVRIGGAL